MKKIAKLIIVLLCLVCINVNAESCPSSTYEVYKDSKKLYCCPTSDDKVDSGICYKTSTGQKGDRNGQKYIICPDKYAKKTIDSTELCAQEDGKVITVNNNSNVCGDGLVEVKTVGNKVYCCRPNEVLFESSGEYNCGSLNSSITYKRDGSNYCSVGTYKDEKCYTIGFTAKEVEKSTGKETKKRAEKEVITTGGSKVEVTDCDDGEVKFPNGSEYVCCKEGEDFDKTTKKCVSKETGEENSYVPARIKQDVKYESFKVDYKDIPYCQIKQVVDTMKIFNKVLTLIKIIIPVLLVIMGTINLAKVLLDDKTDIKNYVIGFVSKFILGILVFFLPTLLTVIYSYAQVNDTSKTDYADCVTCVLNENCPSELYCLDNTGEVGSICTSAELNQNCNSVFGDVNDQNQIAYYMQYAFNIIKYIGIVLCIVLSAVDVVKYILSGDKDGYKSVVGKIVKRLCYACVLVFLPNVLEITFKLLNLYGTCGIK